MSNLEELCLYFVNHNTPIIDGNNFEENIFNNMTKLKKFKFNIRSVIPFNNQVNLLSNEDIQNTFKNLKINKIISCIDYFSKANEFHCHIYSYPYTWNYYDNITNNFHGGLFKCVDKILLFDERPFEHEFFLRIQKSFPFMEELSLINRTAQNRKQSNSDNRNLSPIEYTFLFELSISNVHDDYIEEFLLDTKTYLQNNLILFVNYESLQRVTHHFIKDATRTNCGKISKLHVCGREKRCNSLEEYFPYAKICYSLI